MPDPHRGSGKLRGTVLAFDYGERRIGVAVGELELGVAHPLTTITAARAELRFDQVRALLQEWKPVSVVVGLPVHADGTQHELTRRARRFGHQLEGRFRVAVEWVDERYTTLDARDRLRMSGRPERDQKGVRDALAAQLILQRFFDDRRGSSRDDRARE